MKCCSSDNFKTTVIKSGKVIEIKEVYIRNQPQERNRRSSSPERKYSTAAQKTSNLKIRTNKVASILNTNFCVEDFFLDLTYENEPSGYEEVERDTKNFLRRVQSMLKKQGEKLTYCSVISDRDEQTQEPKRLHVHILLKKTGSMKFVQTKRTAPMELTACNVPIAELWSHGYVWVELVSTIDLTKLACYMLRQTGAPAGKATYKMSRGMLQPKKNVYSGFVPDLRLLEKKVTVVEARSNYIRAVLNSEGEDCDQMSIW